MKHGIHILTIILLVSFVGLMTTTCKGSLKDKYSRGDLDSKTPETEIQSSEPTESDQSSSELTPVEATTKEPLPYIQSYMDTPADDFYHLAEKPEVIIHTDLGDMRIRFFKNIAPNHMKTFVDLAKKGFFDGVIFHRVIPGFMIQGGDPNTKGHEDNEGTHIRTYGTGNPGFNVPMEWPYDETHPYPPYQPGIVAAARSSDPDSAGSQFFIMTSNRPNFGKVMNGQDLRYTIYGAVVEGIDVAYAIEKLPRRQQPPAKDCPFSRVEMTVEVVE
jgi:peptidyl-prolyl cis-trans isomerase B (cyclophilin B)